MAGPTPRQLARTQTLLRIKEHALGQLATAGAGELSLRAVARDLDIVSSGVYRYYPSRDALITDLVLDAYTDLAEHLEHATRPDRRGPRRRWRAGCTALRQWACQAPHRFALVYGSAIPGYRAPADTVEPAGRVVRALFLPAVGTAAAERFSGSRLLHDQLASSAVGVGLDVDAETMLALTAAFARLVGMLTLELNGHFVGGFEPADALFDAVVDREADALGL